LQNAPAPYLSPSIPAPTAPLPSGSQEKSSAGVEEKSKAEESGDGGIAGLLNILGIFASGILGGYVLLKGRDAKVFISYRS